jgi:hypothetical protein
MPNNDTYIKMVLALPDDFFRDWEWQAGDGSVKSSSAGGHKK